MTKRLQVLMEEDELADIRRAARRRRVSVAEWVRTALRRAKAADAVRPPAEKLRAVRTGTRYAFPTGSIEEMLDEIERGYAESSGT